MDAGAEVLAVEPDPQMARFAADKGIAVEVSSFESWEPGGRTFDLVVFAQSFHWVEPRSALSKVATLLHPGGRVAMLWNRIASVRPTREQFDVAYAGLLDDWRRPSVGVEAADRIGPMLADAGFTGERRQFAERLHYATAAWVDLVTTYSNVLTLEPDAQALLRRRLADVIGEAGVDARNDALAVVGKLRGQVSTS
jgi:SAM-dependent methyltransferase